MAAFSNNQRNVLIWYFLKKKAQSAITFRKCNDHQLNWLVRRLAKRKNEFIQAILSCVNIPRYKLLWMYERSMVWFDMVEESFTAEQWYENFRIRKETFLFILNKISEDITRQDTSMRKAISARRRLAITLYYLASTSEYRTIANLFGVSVSFVCNCVKEVCEAIRRYFSNVIRFPTGVELMQVIEDYENKWGFPMCAGCIDGTHIPILAPKENHKDYINRKGFHSFQMQAVVDSQYLFRDVVVGWPGSVHDARVLSNSALFIKGVDGSLFNGVESRKIQGQDIPPLILGDPAYPFLAWLMKRYPENNNTPRIQKVFNYRLSRTRMTVENTFGRFKGRFKRFSKRVDMEVPSLVNVLISSCILHNVCEAQNNEFLPHWAFGECHEQLPEGGEVELDIDDAEGIREALASYFVSSEGFLPEQE